MCKYVYTFANRGHYIFAEVAMAAPVQHAMAMGAVAPAGLHYWPGAAVAQQNGGFHQEKWEAHHEK